MRWLTTITCGLAVSGILLAQALTTPAPLTPDGQVRLAISYLSRLPLQDRPYQWFLSWLGTPASVLTERQQTLSFWLPSMSRESGVEFAREVPGSDGLLWVLDIRDFGWNEGSRRAVALREPYFREPWVGHEAAEALRHEIGAIVDNKTYHVEGVVRADWLFRETAETDRSQSYYDLLYTRERFGKREWWSGDSQYKRGWYFKGANEGGKVDANFPRNERDLEKLLGVDVIADLLRKNYLGQEHGAVVEEGASIVARQNRLIWRIPGLTGAYYKTFDVLKGDGRRDYVERNPELPEDVAANRMVFDAGEIIFVLPNKAQGYLLINQKGDRIESADNKAAIDSTDPRDRRVRTPGSCVGCHGQGINTPENIVEANLRGGLDTKFYEKAKARDTRAFYLGWERKLKGDQDNYTEYVKATCGRKSEANATAFLQARNAYDAPVDLKQACAETGLTEQQLRYIGQKTPHARLLMLLRGRTIPRAVWEADTYRETMLLSVSRKGGAYGSGY